MPVQRIADVARHAGVSTSTVSYVLSGNRPISAETRRRVEASIDALGFIPHAGARSIRRRRTNVVALALPLRPESQVRVQMEFVLSILSAARQEGKHVLLLSTEDGVQAIREVTAGSLVDGVILMEVETEDARVALLEQLGFPTVVLGTPGPPVTLPSIDFDFAAAGELEATNLMDQGHRHIGYVGHAVETFDRGLGFAVTARDAVLRTVRDAGGTATWVSTGGSRADVAESLERLFALDPDITGLVVHNETALPTVLDRLRELGRHVPRDVSVTALAPDADAEHCVPPVSNVDLPSGEMARTSFAMLLEILDGGTPEASRIPPTLQHRGSVTTPRR
ncbi:LacI family DNA-binding transcriptional regulator [Curtobacterium sp. MCBD17_003]|uniref:LacI family DNA-binding transcriptional regulator n=1 Tax=Curtobacterium sp. MCBD17_003 TaxID=2175667 RepID=UPI000DA8F69F|nr:LacI family DNA-binding transcriptional regulator [Curtobacterium sp. MCBD17_003]WIE55924.1 LacI family DNA-binding transcriptional regulator [Curtobacterium sp. MCBD17_003]